MITVTTQTVQKPPSAAELHLARITAILDSYDQRYSTTSQPQAAVLSRLKTDLSAAIHAYDLACQTGESYEVRVARQADLLWQCNQCDYYLDRRLIQQSASFKKSAAERNRGLWQIRLATHAALQFKLLTYVRRVMPGANTTGLAWRDILPGLRLSLLAFLRGH